MLALPIECVHRKTGRVGVALEKETVRFQDEQTGALNSIIMVTVCFEDPASDLLEEFPSSDLQFSQILGIPEEDEEENEPNDEAVEP